MPKPYLKLQNKTSNIIEFLRQKDQIFLSCAD